MLKSMSEKKSEKLKKGKKKNGGRRPGSGRKKKEELLVIKGLKEKIDDHKTELIDIERVSQKGKKTIEKKERLLAMLELLFEEAYHRKNVSAAKEWLDRTLGKAPQALEHSGSIETREQKVPTKAQRRAADAYYETLMKYEE